MGRPTPPEAQGLSYPNGKPDILTQLCQDLLRPERPLPEGPTASFETSLREGGKDQQCSSLLRVTCSEDCVTTAFTYTYMCTHVNMDPPDLICPTAENLRIGGIQERVQVQEYLPPGPHPPGKGSGNTAKATGPQDQGQA